MIIGEMEKLYPSAKILVREPVASRVHAKDATLYNFTDAAQECAENFMGWVDPASFRFRLTADTLAVRLTLPTTKRVVDFHHQAIAHGGRTTKETGEDAVQTELLSCPVSLAIQRINSRLFI